MFKCNGSESHIDECESEMADREPCFPVLVDCGTTSASSVGSSTNIAAAVSVPLLLVLLAVVCGIIIAVFFMWRRKGKQKAERRCILLYIAFQAVPTLSLSMFIVSSSVEKR